MQTLGILSLERSVALLDTSKVSYPTASEQPIPQSAAVVIMAGPRYLASPGLDHEFTGKLLGRSRFQWSELHRPVEWVTRHNLPMMKIAQAEGLPLQSTHAVCHSGKTFMCALTPTDRPHSLEL